MNVLIHLAVHANLEYHRDELLYFALGNHPAFGYATVPPLIGWIAWVMQSFFGHGLFAVKLFPALLSGALILVTDRITISFGGKGYARVLTAVAILCLPVGLRAFHLFQPVPIDLFLWTLLCYMVIRYVETTKDRYLYLAGLVTGIALLNKYLILLLLLALSIGLLCSPHRIVFKRKALYLSAGITFLLILPNMLWQWDHDFPVLGHMAALQENQLVYVDRIGFVMEQLLLTFSVCFLVVAGWVFLAKQRQYRFLAITATLVFLVLLALQGKSYYTIGVYPFLVAAGSVAVARTVYNVLFRVMIPLVVVGLTLPALPIGVPVYKEDGLIAYFKRLETEYGLEIGRRFEDGTVHALPQDYADQLGWEELTAITSKAYHALPDKDKVVIYAENYGQAGAIAVIGKRYGLPEPISFHESFFYWKPDVLSKDVEYFIYINDELGTDVEAAFDKIEVAGRITNVNAREFGTTVYVCSEPIIPVRVLWEKALEMRTDPF
ncbi:glycosyltransferase family 39 protein [Altibacter sp.]|uniref:ArnT family glycosyltransferase n=1 Tax=Altibacter sp. TaxID=2024823 RepID=UPI0025C641C0|nr:glycosyltransferase family 39 protein [Altibacter sp.]